MLNSADKNPGSTKRLRAFLCHSSSDKEEVRKLHRWLKRDGFSPWLDEEELLPGQHWRYEIPRAVKQSDVVIVCLSHSATTKTGYINKELTLALDAADEQPEGAIFIIPVKLEECAVPERLSGFQWVMLEGDGYQRLVRALQARARLLGLDNVAPDPPETVGHFGSETSFVQFMHPGREHEPDPEGDKRWNAREHRRKFLLSPGQYLVGNELRSSQICFWGEWEPESDVHAFVDEPIRDGPRYLFAPFYRRPPRTKRMRLQNTDPFVFGETFYYSRCMQKGPEGYTNLRMLDAGSVILFGSSMERSRFVLDTVFVVDQWRDYGRNYHQTLDGLVPKVLEEVSLGRVGYSEDNEYRLYFGASYRKAVQGMFSFFPCLPEAEAPKGFPRPTITLPGFIKSGLTRGYHATPMAQGDDGLAIWRRVVEQVALQGLYLGVSAAMPRCRE
jgi:hypothetical protein